MIHKTDYRTLLLVLVLACSLRAWQIHESLWLDELHTAWVVHGPLSEIGERARIGNQSSLYFRLVWVATRILGQTELGLRSVSLVSGVTLVAAAFGLLRSWTGNSLVACWGAALVAWDRNFIFYSSEARPYALLQLVAVGQLFCLWRLQQCYRRSLRVTYVALTALLIYLHYTAALLVIAEGVWVLWAAVPQRRHELLGNAASRRPGLKADGQFRREPEVSTSDHGVEFDNVDSRGGSTRGLTAKVVRYTVRQFSVDMTCVALAAVPLFPHILSLATRRMSWTLFVGHQSWSEIASWFSFGDYVVLPACGLAIAKAFERFAGGGSSATKTPPLAIHLVVCWLVVPLCLAWFATTTETARLFFPRYLLASAPAPIIFAGVCLAAVPQARLRTGLLAIVLVTSVYHGGTLQRFIEDGRFLHDRNQDWRGAVQVVKSQDRSRGNPVLVRSGFIEADRLRLDSSDLLRRYCLAPVTSLYAIDESRRSIIPLPTTNPGRLDNDTVTLIRRSSGAWFVINGSARTHRKFERELAETLQRHNLAQEHYVTTTLGELLVIDLRTLDSN